MSHAMSDYEAKSAQVHAALEDSLRGLDGRRLLEVLIQVVEPEINMVFLRFEDALYAVVPWDGGALVQLTEWDNELPTDLGPGAWYQPFDQAAAFRGCSVKQARAIGCAWNGHGIEISFSGELSRTLIIQSIESGEPPRGFVDCLRVGVANYTYRYDRDADAQQAPGTDEPRGND